jgi:hypothetical protein
MRILYTNQETKPIDHFKDYCPNCGSELKLKVIKKQKNMYSRSVRSKVCTGGCGYSEYVSNPREQAITEGIDE